MSGVNKCARKYRQPSFCMHYLLVPLLCQVPCHEQMWKATPSTLPFSEIVFCVGQTMLTYEIGGNNACQLFNCYVIPSFLFVELCICVYCHYVH
jgi:hypothetical protein